MHRRCGHLCGDQGWRVTHHMSWAPSSDTSTAISTRSPTNTCWSSRGVTIRTGGSVGTGNRRSGGVRTPSRAPVPRLRLTFDEELGETPLIRDGDLVGSIVRHRALVDGEDSLLTNVLKNVPGAEDSLQSRARSRSRPWGRSASSLSHSRWLGDELRGRR